MTEPLNPPETADEALALAEEIAAAVPEPTYWLDLTPDYALADDRERWETEMVLEAFKVAWAARDYSKDQSITDMVNELREAFFPPLISGEAFLSGPLGEPYQPAKEPAVPVDQSVTPDFLVCLEDGAKLKSMKRYLSTRFGMTPEAYRAKWGLPADYPMVAPNYAARRAEIAKAQGLGRKPAAPAEDPAMTVYAPEPLLGEAIPQAVSHAVPAPVLVEPDLGPSPSVHEA